MFCFYKINPKIFEYIIFSCNHINIFLCVHNIYILYIYIYITTKRIVENMFL
ncbi:hypothetical protein PFNF54_05518 [Plasmodium falciparum NF54]|uniref:Uncharacterized protein n=1 Tax=Plasmodium falciparum (isolate NF54) TaxID=5843 RepID=W7JMC6_PLAFO|nr:hypothetical protein PFNF54_05518 [Plasmodium falciparum NF54]